jgi:hypothetical protein
MPHAQFSSLLQRLRRPAPARDRSVDVVDGSVSALAGDARFEPIALPGGHARFRSIALPLIGVLVLVASWTVGVSYYFHQRSSTALFVAEQAAKSERAAAMVEASIANDYRVVGQSARSMAERSAAKMLANIWICILSMGSSMP